MGRLTIGSIVLVNFPFANLQSYKKRPAVVVANSSLDTVILCQITSRKLPNAPNISIVSNDFLEGSLPINSYVRPDKLFTIDLAMAEKNQLGILTSDKIEEIKTAIRNLFE